MANRRLTPEQENWLYLNYPEMTNKELASYLSEWIKKDNQKQLERMKALVQEDFCEGTKKILFKRIEAMEKSKGISVSLIKRYARRLHCRSKSREHIISCNQEKAMATNLKRWQKKAEKVEHIMEWLRSFKEKDIRYCFIEGEGQLRSFRVSINKFNRYEGYERCVYLTSEYISEVNLLRVNAHLYRSAY